MKSLDRGCFVVSIYQSELSLAENLENVLLVKQELNDLLVPYAVGAVGVGPDLLNSEEVLILPLTHQHMVESIIKVYNQTTYLLCHPDRCVEVISALPTGTQSTPLGTLIGTKLVELGQTNLVVNGISYVVDESPLK